MTICFLAAATVGAAAVFSYAGWHDHNTDVPLTVFVWTVAAVYVFSAAVVARRWL
jgi:hypothetical protein